MTFWFERGGCGKANLNGLRGARGFSMRFDFIDELDPRLHLRGLRSDLAEAVDEFLVPFDFLVLVPVGLDFSVVNALRVVRGKRE